MMFTDIIASIRAVNNCPTDFLPLHEPVFTGKESEYVLDTIDSTFVSSVGAYVELFECMLQKTTGVAHAVACVNGTAAIQVALYLSGVRSQDLVITQSLSFVATANAICHAGAEPVFLDIDRSTLGLSPQAVQSFLEHECMLNNGICRHKSSSRRIAACVPMHTFGFPCSMEELCNICEEWKIPLVEDAAEALGSKYKGKACGSLGRAGVFSFNGNKIVTSGGGGAIITNDLEMAQRAKHVTTTAKRPHRWKFYHDEIAWNYRMPNINAALGCAQLERLDEFIVQKRELAMRYRDIFADTPWQFLNEPSGCESNYWLCAVLFHNRQERDAFLSATNDAGVMTRPAWEPLFTLPAYRKCIKGDMTTTEAIAGRLVNLPSSAKGKI